MKAQYTIRQFENCFSLQEAVSRLVNELRAGKDVYCQFHQLAPYGGFPIHKHLRTNEWTVVWDAEFDFVTRRGKVNDVQLVRSLNKATVIYVPLGSCHMIRSRESGIKYAVVKDGPDDFHSC